MSMLLTLALFFPGADPCEQPSSPRFGHVNCQKQGADVVCTVSCAMGFRFDTVPAPAYRCSPSGVWSPAKESIPNCVQGTSLSVSSSSSCSLSSSTPLPPPPLHPPKTAWRDFQKSVRFIVMRCFVKMSCVHCIAMRCVGLYKIMLVCTCMRFCQILRGKNKILVNIKICSYFFPNCDE